MNICQNLYVLSLQETLFYFCCELSEPVIGEMTMFERLENSNKRCMANAYSGKG